MKYPGRVTNALMLIIGGWWLLAAPGIISASVEPGTRIVSHPHLVYATFWFFTVVGAYVMCLGVRRLIGVQRTGAPIADVPTRSDGSDIEVQ